MRAERPLDRTTDRTPDRPEDGADAAPLRDRDFEREAIACLPELARFARSLARDPAAADDLVQETYLRAYRGYASFLRGHDVRRWLFSICHHAWLRIVERERRVVLTEDGDEAELETLAAVRGQADASREGIDRFIDELDVGPAIREAIAALPPLFRGVVVLVDVEGLSYDEAAIVLRIAIGTVRSRLFRARRLLQERLLDHARDAGFAAALATRPPTTRTTTP